MQGHCYVFGNLKIIPAFHARWLSPIQYHGVIPLWKGIHIVKMTLRRLVVALLLATVSAPLTAFAAKDDPQAPVVHKPVLGPDGNPWPHMIVGRR
jgi:hypothetical protein